MPDDLEITDVAVSAPRLAAADPERGEQQPWIDITITVRNSSAGTTLHVVSSLRTLRYDPATRTLTVGLSEPDPDPSLPPLHKFPPETTPVLPGESRTVTLAVPLVIKEIRRSGRLAADIRVLDISDVEHVTSSVAYADTPFRPPAAQPSVEMLSQLRQWGTTTERTFDRTIATDQRSQRSDEGGQHGIDQ